MPRLTIMFFQASFQKAASLTNILFRTFFALQLIYNILLHTYILSPGYTLRDVLVAPFLSLSVILGDIIRNFFGATLCVYTALVWLPRYSLLLPDDGQVPKRCKNNGTGSDVICSAMGMGVSTRILFTMS